MKHLEDQLHKQIAKYLYNLEALNLFGQNGTFSYLPFGEKRTEKTGALLKAKGTRKGFPDFIVLYRFDEMTEILWIECKTEKKGSKQTPEQEEFERRVVNQMNENYIVIRNCGELADYFETIGLLNGGVLKKYKDCDHDGGYDGSKDCNQGYSQEHIQNCKHNDGKDKKL